jgi:signal transduction histidine kinase
VLKAIAEINEDTVVITATAYASLDSSIEAMNKGAYAYITKPLNMDEALLVIERALEKQRLSMENKRLLRELKESNEKLKEAAKAKSAFTSMVSHELRTPLGALKESVSQILEGILGPISEGQKNFLEIAKRNVDRLARLINEVLDFQTLETGKMVFKMQDNDINEVVKETKETMNIVAKEKGLDFTLNLDENLPKVRFDRDKISQVLTNIVNNSLKLTEKGSVTITTSRGENIIQVSVKDTGPGIKEEDMPRLFQQYEQLERKVGGTGLGLAISLEIIKAHNGKIWAESKFGQGTTMHFLLPIEERRR